MAARKSTANHGHDRSGQAHPRNMDDLHDDRRERDETSGRDSHRLGKQEHTPDRKDWRTDDDDEHGSHAHAERGRDAGRRHDDDGGHGGRGEGCGDSHQPRECRGESRDTTGKTVDLDQHGRGFDWDIDFGRHGDNSDRDAHLSHVDCGRIALCPDTDPLVALVGGEGNAVGENTLVDADIYCRLVDLGSVTVAFGSATFQSAATSDGDLAYATADTFALISGADIVFVVTKSSSATHSDGDTNMSVATSTTSYAAIDFEAFDFVNGPLVFDKSAFQSCQDHDGAWGAWNWLSMIEGNLATLAIDAEAAAGATMVDVSSSVLVVENQLSSISALVITAGDG